MNISFRITLIILLSIPSFLISQNVQEKTGLYTWFDQIIGVDNTSLYNGTEHKEKYRFLNENSNYFNSSKFLTGNIIYDGELFYDVKLKYDAYQQEVIVRLQNRNLGSSVLKLFNSKIDEFSIMDSKFKKIEDKTNGTIEMSGFYEISFQNHNLIFYKKHQKVKREIFFENKIYPEFIDAKTKNILWYKNKYYLIDSKKDLVNIFPQLKKNISNFYRINKSIQKTTPDVFILEILKEISTLIANESPL